MGKPKWWVCDDCKSLNDLPANKCYNCQVAKRDDSQLIDDQYGVVGGSVKQQRVGITVDLNTVGQLTSPDPLETAKGGGIIEAYGVDDDKPLSMSSSSVQPAAPPPPLRDPVARSITDVGGHRWADRIKGLTQDTSPTPDDTPPQAAVDPAAQPVAAPTPEGYPPLPTEAPPPPPPPGYPPLPTQAQPQVETQPPPPPGYPPLPTQPQAPTQAQTPVDTQPQVDTQPPPPPGYPPLPTQPQLAPHSPARDDELV